MLNYQYTREYVVILLLLLFMTMEIRIRPLTVLGYVRYDFWLGYKYLEYIIQLGWVNFFLDVTLRVLFYFIIY